MPYAPFDLAGKTAPITGGNSGIGLGMAKALADAGASVCIWGTNPAKNESALSELKQKSDRADSFLAGLVPQIQTDAPASASAFAIPRPIPLFPPVIGAVLPARSNGAYGI
jgi:NAD(P)-dependent dehydrogenase (short-subunit alcohol dehydrogenase family)